GAGARGADEGPRRRLSARMIRQTLLIAPPPYDVHNLLNLLGIEVDEEAEQPTGRLTVVHSLIAGTGYLWAPVVVALADALCAFGVSRHWPADATSFTTVGAKPKLLESGCGVDVVGGQEASVDSGGKFEG